MSSTVERSNEDSTASAAAAAATAAATAAVTEAETGQPATKRRRAGRRVSNTDMSAEERKRQRVLKNRESAMRSLAKKAAYSAQLEDMAKREIDLYTTSRSHLQKLLSTALAMRAAIDKVPERLTKLTAEVEASINRGTNALENDSLDPDSIGLPDNEHGNSGESEVNTQAIVNGNSDHPEKTSKHSVDDNQAPTES